MKRPEFASTKVEQKKIEIVRRTDNIIEVLESMIDKKNNKIKNLKSFKQEILIEVSKMFDLPHDKKCAVLRENLQNLPLDKVKSEIYKLTNNL